MGRFREGPRAPGQGQFKRMTLGRRKVKRSSELVYHWSFHRLAKVKRHFYGIWPKLERPNSTSSPLFAFVHQLSRHYHQGQRVLLFWWHQDICKPLFLFLLCGFLFEYRHTPINFRDTTKIIRKTLAITIHFIAKRYACCTCGVISQGNIFSLVTDPTIVAWVIRKRRTSRRIKKKMLVLSSEEKSRRSSEVASFFIFPANLRTLSDFSGSSCGLEHGVPCFWMFSFSTL